MTPPCGVPLPSLLRGGLGLPVFSSVSMIGALNHPRISSHTALSVTRIRTQAMSLSCGMVSK